MRAGGIIAYPTEAVYGLGCLPRERQAVFKILRIKRRSWRKGLIVVAADLDQLRPLIDLPRGGLRAEILASWPGPVTWILPARPALPRWLTGARPTLAVRITDHPVARDICRRAGQALVSTSANRAGRPPHVRVLSLRRAFGAEVDYIVAAPVGGRARPSTIRSGDTGEVIRPG